MPRSFLSVLVLLVGGLGIGAAPTPPAKTPTSKGPSAAEIAKAVDELSNARFAVRERASKFLWEAGSSAEEALKQAAESKDEEIANRAKAILEKFAWGLYPDTPKEVVTLIEEFRGGDLAVREDCIGKLVRMKPIRFSLLKKLISQEKNEEARREMFQRMAFQAREAVPGLLVLKQYDEASELLEICLAQGNATAASDYAALHYFRGTLAGPIAKFEKQRTSKNEVEVKKAAEVLTYLYRAKRDWPAAKTAAAATENVRLIDEVAWEANDWKTLATTPHQGEGDSRGAQAAYHRLAGNKAKYNELIADLNKDLTAIEGGDGSAYLFAHALLLNGEGLKAIDVLKERTKGGSDLVFDLLCAQLKYKEAFAYVDKALKELEKDENAIFDRQQLQLRRGRMLAQLGDQDAAVQIFRGLLDKALVDTGDRFGYTLVTTLMRANQRDLAAECAARLLVNLEKAGRTDELLDILQTVFEEKKYVALVWWCAYRSDKLNAEPTTTMKRLTDFYDKKPDRKTVDQLVQLIEKNRDARLGKIDDKEALTVSQTTDPATAAFAIAEAYRRGEVADKAEEFYKKAIETKKADVPRPPGLQEEDLEELGLYGPTNYEYQLRYADFLFEQKKFKEAAGVYRKAWESSPSQPLPLFLQGEALKKAGDKDQGTDLQNSAHWVPLGNEVRRAQFSEELSKRGYNEDSRREMQIILEACWFRSYYVGNVHLRMARHLARQKDYQKAAEFYEKDVISLFRTGATFIDPKGYLTVPELARTYRIRALFASGKVDEALAETKLGLEAIPGNIEIAINVVPDLDRAGKKKEADEIYGKVKSAHLAALKEFPNSPELLNSLAWSMVNCNRDLDEALKHSALCVKNAPKAAGYLDTLAEIHFRKKDREKALELMKKCAEMEPTNPYFRKQLERFEKKPFDSPLPDEETGDD